jgi:hypothetical protein
LSACMANAECFGFRHSTYQVHARSPVAAEQESKIGVLSVPLS